MWLPLVAALLTILLFTSHNVGLLFYIQYPLSSSDNILSTDFSSRKWCGVVWCGVLCSGGEVFRVEARVHSMGLGWGWAGVWCGGTLCGVWGVNTEESLILLVTCTSTKIHSNSYCVFVLYLNLVYSHLPAVAKINLILLYYTRYSTHGGEAETTGETTVLYLVYNLSWLFLMYLLTGIPELPTGGQFGSKL